MAGPLLFFEFGLLVGFLLWFRPGKKHSEWSVYIAMNIVSGGSYPLTLKLTRKGKDVALPAGAAVVWGDTDPNLGAVAPDAADPTKATIVAGVTGTTGTVTGKVNFNDPVTGNPVELDVASGSLTVVDGAPDAGTIEVGAELP